MKKYKSMFILLGVFAVLILSYLVITIINKKNAEGDSEAIMLTDMVNVTSMDYQKGTDKVSFIKENGVWQVLGKVDLEVDNDAMKELVNTIKKVEAIRVLKGIDDLGDYGLESPSYTITLQEDTAKKVTLYIGNATGDNYYATVGTKEIVYTISGSVVEALQFDFNSLLNAVTAE